MSNVALLVMGIIKEYVAHRRQKKLAEVTQALEQLKHENVATDAFKPKSTVINHNTSYPLMRNGKDLLFIGILLVSVVVLVIISFYYRSQFTSLQDNYDEKVDKLKTLETELREKLEDLNDTKTLLEDTEKELSGKSAAEKKLETKIEDLNTAIDKLEADISSKKSELDNLTRTTDDQRREIKKWKDCIEDEYNGNLSVC